MKINDTGFDKNYDIVIVGLGTAGAIALITAAKRGLKVLGIEALNAMGGTGTLGAISGYYYGSYGGVYETVNHAERKLQEGMYVDSPTPRYDTKAYVLEKMAIDYGADILYETTVTEIYGKEQEVNGLCCFSKGEWLKIQTKMIIDCTGDARICNMAGCSLQTGRKFDGQTQPYSNMAIVINKENHVFSLNKDSGYVNQNNCEDLSNKIVDSIAMLSNIKENSSPDLAFITNASLIGIRQGSTIIGEETVTLEDFLNNKTTNQPIFFAFANVDNHAKDTAFEDDILLDWYVAAGLWEICFSIGIPLGTLIPKGYQGLMVAGRCIAVDHNIASLVRMKSDMEKCGEAAAEIACMAIENGIAVKDVDYKKLSNRLIKSKCLDYSNHIGFTKKIEEKGDVSFKWLSDFDMVIRGLNSEKPGIAIWSVKQMGNKAIKPLRECLNSEHYLLKKNAAIALGLIGDESACETLRNIVSGRDSFIPRTSLKYSYMHGITAIYILGKLGDKNSIDLLLDIIDTYGEYDDPSYQPDELYTTKEDVRFQYISYSLVALNKITKKHPEMKEYIKSNIYKKIFNSDFSILITLKQNPYVKYEMTEKLKDYYKKMF